MQIPNGQLDTCHSILNRIKSLKNELFLFIFYCSFFELVIYECISLTSANSFSMFKVPSSSNQQPMDLVENKNTIIFFIPPSDYNYALHNPASRK